MSIKETTKIFPVHNYGFVNTQKQVKETLVLTFSKNDLNWVQVFKTIGNKRNVYFVEGGDNEKKNGAIVIQLDSNGKSDFKIF